MRLPRVAFSEAKRRVYEMLFDRDRGRRVGHEPELVWLDARDLSPFCGIRPDEILDVFRRHLDERHVRTAATLTIPMLSSRPADLEERLLVRPAPGLARPSQHRNPDRPDVLW